MPTEMNKARRDLHTTKGNLNYLLEVFGDELAKRQKYKSRDGMEAIWFYLVEKYHWLPSTVRAMHPEDIRFLLDDEMHGWTAPKGTI